MACVNLAALPGHEYMFRERAEGSNAITEIFGTVHKKFMDLSEEQLADVDYARHNLPFAGEMYMVTCAIPLQERADSHSCIRF